MFIAKNSLVFVLLLGICFPPLFAQQLHAEEKPLEKNNEKEKPKAKLDYEKLVADLVNRNPKPTNADVDHERATFAKDYDWNELNRIDKSLQILIDNFDESWPTLVKHLNDKEYCLTAHHCTSTDYDNNYSVGHVCRILLDENLANAYIDLIPKNEYAWRQLRFPDSIKYDPKIEDKSDKWYRKQLESKRKFYDLQIETSEWALGKIPNLSQHSSDEEKKQSIADIQKQVEKLRNEKKPVLIKRFNKGDGWRVIVSHERVKK